jgi:hypothetical protein
MERPIRSSSEEFGAELAAEFGFDAFFHFGFVFDGEFSGFEIFMDEGRADIAGPADAG